MKEVECNGLCTIVSQALEEMKAEQGENFSLAAVNLAELQRRTGISRSRLRRLKKNNFKVIQHGLTGKSTGRICANILIIAAILNFPVVHKTGAGQCFKALVT